LSRIAGVREGAGAISSLRFYTETGSVLQEQMRIDENGNVGIGTTAPQRKLHVIGDGNFTGDLSYGTLSANSPHAFINFKPGQPLKKTEICMVAEDGTVVMQTIKLVKGRYIPVYEANAQACLDKEITERIDYEYGYLNTTRTELKQRFDDFLNKTINYIDYINSTKQVIISKTEVKKRVFS
jgi:hypothetical protein